MSKPYYIGLDIGSSYVKASLLDADSGRCAGTAFAPETEMDIVAAMPGWAEQDPGIWWKYTTACIRQLLKDSGIDPALVGGIGISYQMHGLVLINSDNDLLRPSIIWCDSRAVKSGEQLTIKAGQPYCLGNTLNMPGNFTLAKLQWVRDHEPALFERIHKIMLPGDYIALKLTGEVSTTIQGLSEGIMWDFARHAPARLLLDAAGISDSLLPLLVPAFGIQGKVSSVAASETGLYAGTPLTYRAGDQPNNAFSLNVLNPGETAATAGTSGVIYGVTDKLRADPLSRVNNFAHANHTPDKVRLGVLLCINGAGIAYNWMRQATGLPDYESMNAVAMEARPGAEGLRFLPFGNGAERMLGNKEPGAGFRNISYNIHGKSHLLRAVQEGVAFAFHYGLDIMKEAGLEARLINAGNANMFRSSIFCKSISSLSGLQLELYNTDGALGAARGAALGSGYYSNHAEAFAGLEKLQTIDPDERLGHELGEAYLEWLDILNEYIIK